MMTAADRAELVTLGCRLNFADSDEIAARLAKDGAADDLVVVNGCAVTAGAMADTRAAVRRAALRRPGARVVVTGCAAEIAAPAFRAMPEVAGVVGLAAKFDPVAYRASGAAVAAVLPRFDPVVADGRTRAFVGVQTGCDHRCTFCIIPAGRGPSRSATPAAIVARIGALVAQGTAEVVLTGVDLTSYGADLDPQTSLGELVERILRAVPALPRLRLSSLDSIEIDDRLFALVTEEPRVMPHLHLSLQAGDDLILKRMARRHRRADAVRLVERLKARRPEIAIGADLIAGFPTESDAAAANTAALIEDCDIVHAHVFPFSPREGTPAARMPQVASTTLRARAAALRDRAARQRGRWLDRMIGSVQAVLVERGGERGHAPNFAAVRLAGPQAPGGICRVRVTGHDGAALQGAAA